MDMILEILGKLGFDWHLALANLFNFILIAFLLIKFLFPSIKKYLAEREEKIQKGLAMSEEAGLRLSEADEAYESKLTKARQEVARIMEEAQVQADLSKQESINKARQEIHGLIEKTKIDLHSEKQQMLEEVREEAGKLIIASLKNILKKELTSEDEARLITEALKSIK